MSFPYYTTAARQTLSSVLFHQDEYDRSWEARTVLAGDGADRILLLGTVVGMALFGAVVVAAAGGNTGNGVLDAVVLGDAAKVGAYTLTCTAASADGGVFQVVDPEGYRLVDAEVGVDYDSPQLAFGLADGATDFAVGDVLTITVPEGSGKVVALAPDATDGTQLASGVLMADVTAPDGVDASGPVIEQDAILIGDGLIWPDAIDPADKTAALTRLRAAGLTIRNAA